MKKRVAILLSTSIILACTMMQGVQAASSTVGVSTGSTFVWKWTRTTYNNDGSTNTTAVNYVLMNVTALATGTDHLNVSVKLPTTNQSDYEANGVDASHWSSSTTVKYRVLDGNKTTWFQGLFCKSGVTMLELLTLGDSDKTAALSNMHAQVASELIGFYLQMAIAQVLYSGTFSSSKAGSISIALLSYVSGSLSMGFSCQPSGRWWNVTAKLSSSFTYSVFNMVLASADSTLEITEVSWDGGSASYETSVTKVRNEYKAVHPGDLANYIAIEWFIGGGIALVIVLLIAAAIRKKRKATSSGSKKH